MSGIDQIRAGASAATASASWASRSACSGSPCAIATRARAVSADISHQPVAVDDGVVGPAAGRDQIPARQRGLRIRDAPHAASRAGQLAAARPPRSRPAPPQHRRRPGPRQPTPRSRGRVEPAQPRRRLEGRVGGGPGRGRLTPIRERDALARKTVASQGSHRELPWPRPPPRRIVRRLQPDRPAIAAPIRGNSGTGARRTGRRSPRRGHVLLRRPRAMRSGHPARDRRRAPAQTRIWLSLHGSPNARARPIASAKYGPARLGVMRRRSSRRRSAPAPAGPGRRPRARSPGLAEPDPGCRRHPP